MAGWLGRSYRPWGGSIYYVLRVAPQWDNVFVIPYGDLPSGTGAGTEYCVVVMGHLGYTYTTPGTDVRVRLALRWPIPVPEEQQTWHELHLQASPFQDLARLCQPFTVVAHIPNWNSNTDLHFAAQLVHVSGPGPALATLENLIVLVIDAKALGGTRQGDGSVSGPRVLLHDIRQVGAGSALSDQSDGSRIIESAALPWTSGTENWLLFWGAQVMQKSLSNEAAIVWARRSGQTAEFWNGQRFPGLQGAVGSNGLWDGGHVWQMGGFRPFALTGAGVRIDLRGQSPDSNFQSRTRGGCVCAIKMDGLDGAFSSVTESPLGLDNALADGRYDDLAYQQYSAALPRDLTNYTWLSQILAFPTLVNGLPSPAHSFGVIASMNRWPERRLDLALWPHVRQTYLDSVPLRDHYVGTTPYYGREGANYLLFDPVRSPWSPSIGSQWAKSNERIAVGLQLSDFGTVAPPPPPSYTDIVVPTDREVPDLSELPVWWAEPHRYVIKDDDSDYYAQRSMDRYVVTLGKATKRRSTATCSWSGLTKEEVTYLATNYDLTQGAVVRAVRWLGRPWIMQPGGFTLSDDPATGFFTVNIKVIEAIYFGD